MKTLSVINVIELLMFITFRVTSALPIKCGGQNSNTNQYSHNINGNYGSFVSPHNILQSQYYPSAPAMNYAALRTQLSSGVHGGGYGGSRFGYDYKKKELGGINRHELCDENYYNNRLAFNKILSNAPGTHRLIPMDNFNYDIGEGARLPGNKIITPAYFDRPELMKNIHGHSSNPLCLLLNNGDSTSSYDMGNLFGSMGHEAIANVEMGPFNIYGHSGLSIGNTLSSNKFGQDNFASLYNGRLKGFGGNTQDFRGDILSQLNNQRQMNRLWPLPNSNRCAV